MTRRIGLAQALINEPELILLDEPTSGLDPIGTREMKDMILRLRDQGKTVVMCSHLLADVQDVCDRIAILHQGELKELGRVDSLLTQADVTQIRAKTPARQLHRRNSPSHRTSSRRSHSASNTRPLRSRSSSSRSSETAKRDPAAAPWPTSRSGLTPQPIAQLFHILHLSAIRHFHPFLS